MLHSKSVDDPVLRQRVEGAARWMDATMRTCDADVVEDWEVDELLNWSTGLDFDDYWKDWHSIATSDLSEAAVCKSFYCSQLHYISIISKLGFDATLSGCQDSYSIGCHFETQTNLE